MDLRKLTLRHGVRAAFLAGAAVIVVGVVRGETSLGQYLKLEKSRGVLQKAVEDLRRENQTLGDEIVRLKESPAYARKVLRDKYHVTEPDEGIIFFAE